MLMPASGEARAHTATGNNDTNFYRFRWIDDVTVAWRFTQGFTTTATFRQRIRDGANAWNNPAGGNPQPLQWWENTNTFNDFDPDTCPDKWYQQNGIHWRVIDGAAQTLGYVQACWFTNAGGVAQLLSTNMVIDRQESWYSGTGTPGLTQFDLWSVASHERGHMSGSLRGQAPEGDGQGHFLEADNTICGALAGSNRATMCPAILIGDNQQRDLEGGPNNWHDTHTFQAAY